jgi:hypothetical protein
MPTVGERHQAPGAALPSEWTGTAWTPVCPVDDVPMGGRDEQGWLCCQECWQRYDVLADLARARQ